MSESIIPQLVSMIEMSPVNASPRPAKVSGEGAAVLVTPAVRMA